MNRTKSGADISSLASSASGGEAAAGAEPLPARIAGYSVKGELGRGGMARVYHVVEERSGRELALKQLRLDNAEQQRQVAPMFEREFHTLAQLRHPSVIEVYDYGIAEPGPYYTMELLDGGDLRKNSPLPWRRACELLFDVCSSLALLHSRRLVHRDITPRNVRCTRTGSAKLIDFGAMVPMGVSGQIVGTPAFVAPEVLQRASLDGRTDLYSLGATLYYALTSRAPYTARRLSDMLSAWRAPPPAPSAFVPDIPPELDRLVLALLSIEPALRPRGAYEVMQRLRVLAAIERDEASSVTQAYLATPSLVGREEPLAVFQRQMQRAMRGHGGGVLLEAEPGFGRSRLLDACALEAKLLGATNLRASADSFAHSATFAAARSLCEQLLDAHPESALECAREIDAVGVAFEGAPDPVQAAPTARTRLALRPYPQEPASQLRLQQVLVRWLLRVSREHALLIAVDDADRIDDASLALIAGIAHHARQHPLLLATTAASPMRSDAPGLSVLASRSTKLDLRPLDRNQTELLLMSVFGDVPNLSMLAEHIHEVAQGRPRECIALAQHLIDRGVVAYTGGSWTLPERLAVGDLPARDGVFEARVQLLGPRARRLAALQALALFDEFGRGDYAALDPAASSAEVDAALDELLAHEIVRSDGLCFRLSNAAVRAALIATVEPAETAALHRALAELHEREDRPGIGTVAHLLSAGLEARGVDRMLQLIAEAKEPEDLVRRSRLTETQVALQVERALDAAERLVRRPRERFELTRWLFLFSLVCEERLHARTAPALLARLELDSGLAHWRGASDVTDAGQRLTQALTRAAQEYGAAPEEERVYRVDEAIQNLVYYVLISIAVGARTMDGELIDSLAGLLEPFAPLSPAVHAIWQNAIATREIGTGQPLSAYDRWLVLYSQLESITPEQLKGVDLIRNAIAFGLGTVDAQIGRDGVARWAAVLDKDPLQQVTAMYLRRTLCLYRGDFESAERFRRRAELLAVQSKTRQMFNSLVVELSINELVRDLTGVKQVGDRIASLAVRHPGWRPFECLARAYFHWLSSDLEAARAACEQGLALTAPGGAPKQSTVLPWSRIAAAYIEILVELERAAEARAFGERALEQGAAVGFGVLSHEVGRSLALAEAKLGDTQAAAARLDAIIRGQQAYGGHGLILGGSYEARARIAIWAGDSASVEHYGQLAAHEYRHGRASPLGGRYERLLEEARTAGIHALPPLDSFTSTHLGTTSLGGSRTSSVEQVVTSAFRSRSDGAERARIALQLLCEAHGAHGGHLFVVRDGQLVLAASFGAEPADKGLSGFIDSFWERNLLEPDLPTAFVPEQTAQSPATAGSWADGRGTQYQPVVISCTNAGMTMHVGVAALIPGVAFERNPNAMQITSTIGSQLLGAGDAHGLPA